jgi:hypothetical protein
LMPKKRSATALAAESQLQVAKLAASTLDD